MSSVFEKLIEDFSQKDSADLLGRCMDLSGNMKRIPLRYRIIAMGFVRRMSLKELNDKLISAGCEKLYARNSQEASLIYAFSNRMSYAKWKELSEICSQMREMAASENRYFQSQNISYADLRDYVSNHSWEEEQVMYTQRVTHFLEQEIERLPDDQERFRLFLLQNTDEFSRVREKARYYFCKYLCYYIEEKINCYLKALSSGNGKEDALSELLVLKGISVLRRKKMPPDEAGKLLRGLSVSCGNIYDAFNYFYFEYVSNDWMEVLLEYYGGNITMLSGRQKQQLADALRAYTPDWKDWSEDDILKRKWQEIQGEEQRLDMVYALDGTDRGYQKNRSGEKSVRNYIKGKLDIDRTTLLCYLIFFGKNIHVEPERMITRRRLNVILKECGFRELTETDEIDGFILHYLQESDQTGYLMESVTKRAFENRNFFLYHMYYASINNEEQLQKVFRTI